MIRNKYMEAEGIARAIVHIVCIALVIVCGVIILVLKKVAPESSFFISSTLTMLLFCFCFEIVFIKFELELRKINKAKKNKGK